VTKRIEQRHEDPEVQRAFEIYDDLYSLYTRKSENHRKGASHFDYENLTRAWNNYLKLRKEREGK
jgi:hypothetical protein